MLEILILSLVQGITEFLPISSSSHIILFSKFMNFISEDLILNVSLHIGSFLAGGVFFRKDIANFIQNKGLFLKILVAVFMSLINSFSVISIKYSCVCEWCPI